MLKPKAHKLYEAGLKAERAGKFAAAAKSYAASLKLAPTLAEAANNLGRCRLRMGNFAAASSALERANALRPDDPTILGNLSEARRAGGDLAGARDALRRRLAAAFDPWAARNLISLQRALGEGEDALATARRLAAAPDATLADRSQFLFLALSQCDWDASDAISEADISAWLDADDGYAGSPFRYYSHVSDPSLLLRIARRAAAETARTSGAEADAAAPPPPAPTERLRVGVISQDLRDHPMLKLISGALAALDPARFELHVYALGSDSDDPRRGELKSAAAVFRAFDKAAPATIAASVRRDDLHVLIDLMGYTRNAAPEVLALRPAATQASWLGLPGTTGAPWIDHVVADEVVIAPGAEGSFSETVTRIAPTYYPFDDRSVRPAAAPDRAALGLPADGPVLACFNQSFKLDPMRFATWCGMLERAPGATLWLLDPGAAAAERLRGRAEAAGVDADRIVIAPRVPHDEHYRRIMAADVAVDTWLYGGHTTTIDALWLGVPVVTRIGPTFTSRVAASILRAAGLDMLVAESEAEYAAIALRLVQEPEFSADIRARIAALKPEEPPFGAQRFARSLEAALAEMADRGAPAGTGA